MHLAPKKKQASHRNTANKENPAALASPSAHEASAAAAAHIDADSRSITVPYNSVPGDDDDGVAGNQGGQYDDDLTAVCVPLTFLSLLTVALSKAPQPDSRREQPRP